MRFLFALAILGIAALPLAAAPQGRIAAAPRRHAALRVGVAGSEPFVVEAGASIEGVSIEIWQALAARTGWRYEFKRFESVPEALDALTSGDLDVVVGPVSITAERARHARFSQPYYESSLSILSRTEAASFWQRIAPFFNRAFYSAVGALLFILTLVGALVWLAERHVPESQFPKHPARGIANGIWFAVVTMSTVGYGDLSPKTHLGRFITGVWIIVSVIAASSLVAGIASALTLTGLKTSAISTAEELTNRRVAVLADSPGQVFALKYGAHVTGVTSLPRAYELLISRGVDAVVFDRPQLLYFLQHRRDSDLAVSNAQYVRQNYGFALPLSSNLTHTVNVNLLDLQESGRVDRVVRAWLGETPD